MGEEFERLHAAEKDTGGKEVHVEPGARRLSNIFNKTSVFDPLLAIGPALAAAHYLLGEIKVHGANIRDPEKGHGRQQLHVDVPKKFVDDWWLVNAMVLFDDMTLDNGPTRVVPGSQHWAPINVPVVNQGDWVALTYYNEGLSVHPMHLHQFPQLVTAKDGIPLPSPYWVDTLPVAPGERYTVLFQADQKGTWAFHCHILSHAERDTGMFGMVTAVVVQ